MRDFLIGWVEDIFGSGMFSSVEEILTMNPSKDFDNVWDFLCNVYESVCVPIGSGLVLIYFMVNVLEKSTQQQSFDIEHMFKLLLKLFFGLYLIEHGLELMAAIYALSFAFVEDILFQGTVYGTAGANWQFGYADNVWRALTGESIDSNEEWGLLKIISPGIFPVFFQLIIPWLCTVIMKIVVNFVCYTRLIEFYLKTAAAPIALSDFFTEGIHSNGWKFVKGYIATALQAGVIILAVCIFNGISSDIISGGGFDDPGGYWKFLFKYLALCFATVGVMLKSMSLAKELVGVQ